ncbi:hypothetical protein RRG08_000611 [Elysia crispata]|uniref:Uncharacterized protein n=1 Tax=Elysia crispata TaxID=231223 RepID=A0AAE0Y9Z9_9GAST|nr:hypothetical protein RRG08_000611 [Elysia crispata]
MMSSAGVDMEMENGEELDSYGVKGSAWMVSQLDKSGGSDNHLNGSSEQKDDDIVCVCYQHRSKYSDSYNDSGGGKDKKVKKGRADVSVERGVNDLEE